MNALHLVLPWPIGDPLRPSGGNIYDARIRDGLRVAGWECREQVVAGDWPRPGNPEGLRCALADIGMGALVLVDGVMGPGGAAVLAAAAHRLRIVVLLHMPFGEAFPELAEAEHRVLAAAAAAITTSEWTCDWICSHYGLPAERVRVATPGVDAAHLATRSTAGNRILCVANVSWLKGHDVLVAALAALRGPGWTCTCVGALPKDGDFVRQLQTAARSGGIGDRLRWTGALSGSALEAAWSEADVLVLASRRESYGMVIGEALAHGLPVIATRVGGVAEALGRTADGELPGLLVEPDSPRALAEALRTWLKDAGLRTRLRMFAAERRGYLRGWDATTAGIGGVLEEVQRGDVGVA